MCIRDRGGAVPVEDDDLGGVVAIGDVQPVTLPGGIKFALFVADA